MSNIEIVGLGALNIDRIYQVERILDDGEGIIDEATSSPGGSAANTIYGLAKLGVKTGFAGVVGDDAEGKTILHDFRKVGVDTSQIKVKPEAKTGSVLCLSDKLGRRSLYVLPGANNLLTIDDLDLSYINQAKVLHVSSFVDDGQFKMSLELIKRLNLSTKISFAPGALYAVKGIEALTPILNRTHILFINQNELHQLTGEGILTGVKSCLEQGCHIVAVTLGKGTELKLGKGINRKTVTAVSYIRDAEGEYSIEADNSNSTPQTDTTGAGDAFAAGFLYGLLNSEELEECGRLGNIVAQLSLSKVGAREGLPAFSQLAQRYHELYATQL